jgi:Tol biopolymer transport system component
MTYPGIGSFSRDGARFIYSEPTIEEGPAIWRADLAAAGGSTLENREIIRTQYSEMDAQPSPDGTRIVWRSDRTGFGEIWMAGAAGESPLQLTHVDPYSGSPRWSPDGRWIAFNRVIGNRRQIFVVDSEGRNLRAITNGPYDNLYASWSRDGRSIYYGSMRTGSWQVWKHSLEDGTEVQLTKNGGFDPTESYDGKTIYFSKFYQAGIWRIPASGGVESLIVADKPQYGYCGYWAVAKTGIYLLHVDAEAGHRIEFYDFATRRTSPVLTLEKRPTRLQPSLSATADGRTVYYTQFDQQSVIKMMEISH